MENIKTSTNGHQDTAWERVYQKIFASPNQILNTIKPLDNIGYGMLCFLNGIPSLLQALHENPLSPSYLLIATESVLFCAAGLSLFHVASKELRSQRIVPSRWTLAVTSLGCIKLAIFFAQTVSSSIGLGDTAKEDRHQSPLLITCSLVSLVALSTVAYTLARRCIKG